MNNWLEPSNVLEDLNLAISKTPKRIKLFLPSKAFELLLETQKSELCYNYNAEVCEINGDIAYVCDPNEIADKIKTTKIPQFLRPLKLQNPMLGIIILE